MKKVCSKHGQAYEVGQGCLYCEPVVSSPLVEEGLFAPSDWKSYCHGLTLPPPGDLWLHSAAIGEYKTQFALNLCHYLKTQRCFNILYISFEDRRQILNSKMETIHGGSDFWNWAGIFATCDSAQSISDVEAEVRAMQIAMVTSMLSLDLVVIDGYDVSISPSQAGVIQMTQFSRAAGVPILMTKQLDRTGYVPKFYNYTAMYHTRTLKATSTKAELVCLKNKLAIPHGPVAINVDKAYHRFE